MDLNDTDSSDSEQEDARTSKRQRTVSRAFSAREGGEANPVTSPCSSRPPLTEEQQPRMANGKRRADASGELESDGPLRKKRCGRPPNGTNGLSMQWSGTKEAGVESAEHGQTAGVIKLKMRYPTSYPTSGEPKAWKIFSLGSLWSASWTCTKHWATNEPMYKEYTGPNGEVRSDRASRRKIEQLWMEWYPEHPSSIAFRERYPHWSTWSEPEAASAPAEAYAPVTEQQPSRNTTLGTADGAAASDDEHGAFVAAMQVWHQEGAPGVLASTLDGAGWTPKCAEKRPRTKPECFEAGAAPPPSAAHAAHRAKAAKEAAGDAAFLEGLMGPSTSRLG